MEDTKEFGYTYYKYPTSGHDKAIYEGFMTGLTREGFFEDIKKNSEGFLENVGMVLQVQETRSGRIMLPELSVDLYTAEMFYLYAAEGIPRFLMRNEGGVLREQTPEELADLYFAYDLNAFLNYNDYFGAAVESGGSEHSYALDVVLNKFVARIKMDAGFYAGDFAYLSIPEVALLAGMKEKSVRNVAHKEIGAESNVGGMTMIRSDKALPWLKQRRNFVESRPLQSQACIDQLLAIQEEFFA
jgi:hypothetical protein